MNIAHFPYQQDGTLCELGLLLKKGTCTTVPIPFLTLPMQME